MITVIGGSGFVGAAVVYRLNALGVEVTSLSSKDVDLTLPIKCQEILDLFKRSHSIVFCSAKAPAKSHGDFY